MCDTNDPVKKPTHHIQAIKGSSPADVYYKRTQKRRGEYEMLLFIYSIYFFIYFIGVSFVITEHV